MGRFVKTAAMTLTVLTIGSAGVRIAVLAQAGADTRGVPPKSQLSAPDHEKTVPLKITTRAYDMKKLVAAPVLSEEATAGRALWQQRCAYCHDGMGQPTYKTMGPWIDSEIVKQLGPDTIKAFTMMGTPRMPSFKYDLDATQMNNVIEFLKTVSPSLKPTPAQLEGKETATSNAE